MVEDSPIKVREAYHSGAVLLSVVESYLLIYSREVTFCNVSVVTCLALGKGVSVRL